MLRFGGAAVTALQAVELARVDDAAAVQQVTHQQPQDGDAVDTALEERRGRRLSEVPGGHRHLGDAHFHVDDLGQNLLIENKLVGIIWRFTDSRTSRRKARYPVWYSERRSPKTRFSRVVRKRLE